MLKMKEAMKCITVKDACVYQTLSSRLLLQLNCALIGKGGEVKGGHFRKSK